MVFTKLAKIAKILKISLKIFAQEWQNLRENFQTKKFPVKPFACGFKN